MAVFNVFLNGVRPTNADTNTDWANLGGGGPAPAAEPQLAYQGTNAVNRKVTSTASRTGVQYDPAVVGSDYETPVEINRRDIWVAKVYVADFGDLNTTYGIELRLGSTSSDYYSYNVAGTGAAISAFDTYPSQGGYLILGINPTVATYRDGTTGTPDLSDVPYYGVAAQFVTGGAKSENLAMDAIDVGRGLYLRRGGDGDPVGTFADVLDFDQNTTSNRWGVIRGTLPVITCVGKLFFGYRTIDGVNFADDEVTVLFADGYFGPGDTGFFVDFRVAGDVKLGGAYVGLGTGDRRPDYTVSGTATGSSNLFYGSAENFREFDLTSQATISGALVEADRIIVDRSMPHILESTLRATSTASGTALITDPVFATTSGLHDCTIVQTGSGYALSINQTGAYQFSGLTFTGFGETNTTSAAVENASGGAISIEVLGGGNSPTYNNASGAETTTIINNTSITLTGLVDPTEVRVYNSGTTTEIAGQEDVTTGTFVFSATAAIQIDIRIFATTYEPIKLTITVPASATSIPIQQRFDRNYSNP